MRTSKLRHAAEFLDVPGSYFFEERGIMAVETGYLPSEEAKFLRLFKRLDGKYKKAALLFMELATRNT